MLNRILSIVAIFMAVSVLFTVLSGGKAFAHCDTLDGPVVQDAKIALQKKDVAPILKWISKEHEPEIRQAFSRTLAVRATGKKAQKLADLYFFETLVRIHRAGEGAPYTGLKPAGTIHPAIADADKALHTGSIDALAEKIGKAVSDGIKKRFKTAFDKKKHADHNVEAGREFVESYVQYVHFIEGIHNLVIKGAEHNHDKQHKH